MGTGGGRRRSQVTAAAWVAALLVASGCSAGTAPPGPGSEADADDHPRATYALDGADVTVHDGARMRLRVRATQVMLVPRNLGPLEVGILKELVVTGARFAVQGEAPCGSASPCTDRFLTDPTLGVGSLAGGRGAFRLATGALRDAAWVVERGGAVIARIAAQEGRIALGGRGLVLNGFELEQVWANRRVRAERAVWDAGKRAFWIAGEFVLEEGTSTRTGRGLLIGIGEPG